MRRKKFSTKDKIGICILSIVLVTLGFVLFSAVRLVIQYRILAKQMEQSKPYFPNTTNPVMENATITIY